MPHAHVQYIKYVQYIKHVQYNYQTCHMVRVVRIQYGFWTFLMIQQLYHIVARGGGGNGMCSKTPSTQLVSPPQLIGLQILHKMEALNLQYNMTLAKFNLYLFYYAISQFFAN